METQTNNTNAADEQALTDDQTQNGEGAGKPEDGQSLSDSEKVVAGLNRSVTAKNKEIKRLTEELEAAKAAGKSGEGESEELATSKKELAKVKLLLKYKDVADKLEKVLEKVDPEVVDDDFVSMFRSSQQEEETEGPAHNPGRRVPSEQQNAEKLLRSLPSLFE